MYFLLAFQRESCEWFMGNECHSIKEKVENQYWEHKYKLGENTAFCGESCQGYNDEPLPLLSWQQ